jgi:hypothetical protein
VSLRQPEPSKNPNWIPVIVFKNKKEIEEFSNIQETFRHLKQLLPFTNNQIYDLISEGVFNFKPFHINGTIYEFRTNEERRQKHFEELELNKETGRKGR